MCEVARVDAKDFNTSITQNMGILLEDDTNAYVFWSGRDPTFGSSTSHNAEIWVRPINKTSLALGTAVKIDTNNTVGGEEAWDWDGVAVCRLDDGTMIAAYGTNYLGVGPSIHAKESSPTDYTSWGSRFNGFTAGAGRCLAGLATDGTDVWILSQDNNTADIYVWGRTAANTWAIVTTTLTGGKIFDSQGFTSTAPWFALSSVSGPGMSASCMRTMVRDGLNGCMVAPYAQTTTALDAIAALTTGDGWATSNAVVLVKNYAASADSITAGTASKLVYDAVRGFLYCMWLETNSVIGKTVPVIARSEDFGLTWDLLGTPTPFQTFDWDEQWDGAFNLDEGGQLYVSGFDTSDGSNIKHHLYKGTYSLTDWTTTTCQHLEATSIGNVAGGSQAEGFINAHGDFVRILNGTVSTHNEVNYLIERNVTIPDIPPPPLVEESPSGSDATNIVLRNRLSTQRGWSAHDWPFSCFALWPEGDYTTQRRLPTKIAGMSTIDPSVSSPTNIAAICAFDVPEHYGRERFMNDAETGAIVPRIDPFPCYAYTKAFSLADEFGQAIVRGVLIRYRRTGEPLFVQTFIDGQMVQTDELPITSTEADPSDVFPIGEKFLPLARLINVGNICQLRFEDDTVYPFIIESVGLKIIPKKVRARYAE